MVLQQPYGTIRDKVIEIKAKKNVRRMEVDNCVFDIERRQVHEAASESPRIAIGISVAVNRLYAKAMIFSQQALEHAADNALNSRSGIHVHEYGHVDKKPGGNVGHLVIGKSRCHGQQIIRFQLPGIGEKIRETGE